MRCSIRRAIMTKEVRLQGFRLLADGVECRLQPAVRTLTDMGYKFLVAPMCVTTPATAEADAMHALLVARADALEGCTENSPEAREVEAIAAAVEAYEAKLAQWQGTRRQKVRSRAHQYRPASTARRRCLGSYDAK